MERPIFSSTLKMTGALLESYSLVRKRQAERGLLLPVHRLPVIAKTPMLIALGIYFTGGRFDTSAALFTMLLTSGLWATLYAVNETTDLECEKHQTVNPATLMALGCLCVGLIGAAYVVSPRLALLLGAMTLGQLVYCVPPIRLKRHWWAVLLLSGALNPVLRLECGALWGVHSIPPLAYAVFVSLHLGASSRSRCLLRDRDRRLGYRVAPPRTEWAGIAFTGAGLTGAYLLSIQHVLPPAFSLFTTLAAIFSVYAWSDRVGNVGRLRQNWLWFALISLLALAILLSRKPHTVRKPKGDVRSVRYLP